MAYGAGAYGAHPYAGIEAEAETPVTPTAIWPLIRYADTGLVEEIRVGDTLDPAALPTPSRVEATFQASATVQALHVVALLNDNTVRPADASLAGDVYKVFGVALNAALVGEDCTVVLEGLIQSGTWTEGSVYLSADGIGTLASAAPAAPSAVFALDMGAATGTSTLLVRPQRPILVV